MPRFREDADPELESEDALFQGGLPDEEELDFDDEFEDEDDQDPEDEEEELTPAQRNAQRAREGAALAAQRRALEDAGLATVNGHTVIADPARYQQFQTAHGFQTPAAPAADEAAAETTEEPDEMPDPTYDAEGYAAWQKRQQEKTQATIRNEVRGALAQLTEPLMEQRAEAALVVAEEVLPGLRIGHVLDHDRFEELFTQTLRASGRPMKDWTDPELVAQVAGILLPKLAKLPTGKQPRRPNAPSERGDFARRTVGQAAASRSSHAAAGPSRSTGRAANTDNGYTREELHMARVMRCSPAAARAAADPSGGAIRRVRAREEARGKK